VHDDLTLGGSGCTWGGGAKYAAYFRKLETPRTSGDPVFRSRRSASRLHDNDRQPLRMGRHNPQQTKLRRRRFLERFAPPTFSAHESRRSAYASGAFTNLLHSETGAPVSDIKDEACPNGKSRGQQQRSRPHEARPLLAGGTSVSIELFTMGRPHEEAPAPKLCGRASVTLLAGRMRKAPTNDRKVV